MAAESEPLFYEDQSFRQRRLWMLTAIPPVAMLILAIWQVGFGHAWGEKPMSNASIIGWTVFVWIIYFRLITVKLVTEVRPGELRVAMRGLWRSSSVALNGVKSVQTVAFDPRKDWGGYGIRTTSRGRAFIAGGTEGVEMAMANGGVVLVSSQKASELARAIKRQIPA